MNVPLFGRKAPSARGVPVFPYRPEPRREKVPGTGGARLAEPKTWDIGAGPWYWDGKPATRPEYLTLKMLSELGWRPQFQISQLGGRTLPGGQVWDIVLDQATPPIIIDVRGSYWHGGAEKTYYDMLRENAATNLGYKCVVVWEDRVDWQGWLRGFLLAEVGARGR